MTAEQLRLEIKYAKRKAAQAVDALRRDVHVYGAPDRDIRRKAQAAIARVNWLRDQMLSLALSS